MRLVPWTAVHRNSLHLIRLFALLASSLTPLAVPSASAQIGFNCPRPPIRGGVLCDIVPCSTLVCNPCVGDICFWDCSSAGDCTGFLLATQGSCCICT